MPQAGDELVAGVKHPAGLELWKRLKKVAPVNIGIVGEFLEAGDLVSYLVVSR